MAENTFNIFDDPEFKALPPLEQHKVLIDVDPEYNNLPPQEQNKVIRSLNPAVVEAGGKDSTALQRLLQSDDARVASKIAKETLQASLMAGGGLLGGYAGLQTGNPYLAIAGGGLGTTIGQEVADLLTGRNKVDQLYDASGERVFQGPRDMTLGEASGKAAVNLGVNTALESLGAAAPVAAKNLIDYLKVRPTVSTPAARVVAGRRLESAFTPPTQQEFQNIVQEGQRLEQTIPNFRMTQGMSGSALNAAEERQLTGTPYGRDLYNINMDKSQQAVRDYAEQNIGKGGNIGETQQALQDIQNVLDTNVQALAPQNLPLGTPYAETGEKIQEGIMSKVAPVKQEASRLFGEVPVNQQIPATNTKSALQAFIDDKTIPNQAKQQLINDVNLYAKTLSDTPTVGELQAVYSNFGDLSSKLSREGSDNAARLAKDIRAAVDADFQAFSYDIKNGAVDINYKGVPTNSTELAMALSDAKVERGKAINAMKPQSAIDALDTEIAEMTDALNNVDPVKNAQASLESARRFYREEYVNKFKTPDIQAARLPGAEASGFKMEAEKVPARFTNVTGAKQLKTALGDNDATAIMRDHFNYEVGNIPEGQYVNWLKKNAPALKEYGIYNEFSNIAKQREVYNAAVASKEVYEKSIAGKILKTDDVSKLINQIISNPGMAKANMQDLIQNLGGNTAAVNGLKSGMRDHVLSNIENASMSSTGDNILSAAKMQQIMKSYRPAMEALYSKAEMQAMDDVASALNLIANDKIRVQGGGSGTAQNLSDLATISGIPGAPDWIVKLIKLGKSIGSTEQNKLMVEAYFDPKLAADLKSEVQNSTLNRFNKWIENKNRYYGESMNLGTKAFIRGLGNKFMYHLNLFSQPE